MPFHTLKILYHQGKELSYNNINDTDAAIELVAEFDPADGPACAIIKHANPCGVARGTSMLKAYKSAFNRDNVSPFGGIIALNQRLDGETAAEIAKIFTEVVVAPGADDEAKQIFAAKKNLRLLTVDSLPDPRTAALTYRQVSGGVLVQDKDNGYVGLDDLKVVTKRAPTDAELADLMFAWRVAKHVKSNAILLVKDNETIGIGAGQVSRVDAVNIALKKSGKRLDNSILCSDAFFPFRDSIDKIANTGIRAVIQPGGSIRDKEVIEACNEYGISMVFTGLRHFKH